MIRTLCSCSLVLPLILAAQTPVAHGQEFIQQPAQAQPGQYVDPNDWAKAMFDASDRKDGSISHDFGVVARGAEVTHKFRIKNLYKETVQISTVTTSCGCTAPQFDNTPVPSGGETVVTISMDTLKFQHLKTSTVTVQFAAPRFAEVKIPVQVYIRSDVVFTPPSVNFGAIAAGEKSERSLEIAYAGRPDWKIAKVVTGDPNIQATAVETARNGGQVNYRLDVKLAPDAPVGLLRKQLTLVTDDASGGEIPVWVQAHLEGDVTITPSAVQLGTVSPGGETIKTVLLRGHKPFVIEKVECDSNRQAFRMPPLAKEPKAIHVLSLSFTAPREAGPFKEKFIVTIAGRKDPIVFTAQGDIQNPPTQALNSVPANLVPQGQ